ncbi:hypothetical protein BLOT_010825 [Blomia tropicalis]|nr:hypothetical protein BLOT_010825 [Blomia tropicalis]
MSTNCVQGRLIRDWNRLVCMPYFKTQLADNGPTHLDLMSSSDMSMFTSSKLNTLPQMAMTNMDHDSSVGLLLTTTTTTTTTTLIVVVFICNP